MSLALFFANFSGSVKIRIREMFSNFQEFGRNRHVCILRFDLPPPPLAGVKTVAAVNAIGADPGELPAAAGRRQLLAGDSAARRPQQTDPAVSGSL